MLESVELTLKRRRCACGIPEVNVPAVAGCHGGASRVLASMSSLLTASGILSIFTVSLRAFVTGFFGKTGVFGQKIMHGTIANAFMVSMYVKPVAGIMLLG